MTNKYIFSQINDKIPIMVKPRIPYLSQCNPLSTSRSPTLRKKISGMKKIKKRKPDVRERGVLFAIQKIWSAPEKRRYAKNTSNKTPACSIMESKDSNANSMGCLRMQRNRIKPDGVSSPSSPKVWWRKPNKLPLVFLQHTVKTFRTNRTGF